jgi:hypothetical protein
MALGVPGITVLTLPVSTIRVGLMEPGGLVASLSTAVLMAAGAGGPFACCRFLPAVVASAGSTWHSQWCAVTVTAGMIMPCASAVVAALEAGA